MTSEEIHEFGIRTVFDYIKKEGHEIVSVNADVSLNPQIIAKKNGQLEFIVVRTACYPSKGEIENNKVAMNCIEHADKHKATLYFASVGIANSQGKSDAEMAVPVKGAGYYVAFEGLVLLTRSDRVKVMNRS
jgi:hypothetical protein